MCNLRNGNEILNPSILKNDTCDISILIYYLSKSSIYSIYDSVKTNLKHIQIATSQMTALNKNNHLSESQEMTVSQ